MPPRHYYVYILPNKASTVLYTGVTNDLKRRVYEHRTNAVPGFTSRFRVHRLVYYEQAVTFTALSSERRRSKVVLGGARWHWWTSSIPRGAIYTTKSETADGLAAASRLLGLPRRA
jgi:putative endonuclease